MRAILILALVMLSGRAHAFDWKCWAKPHSSECQKSVPILPPAPASSEPVQAPVVEHPPVYVPVQPSPQAAPVAPVEAVPPVPTVTHPKAAKAKPPKKQKKERPKQKRKRVVAMPAWYSCAKAREKVAGKTKEQIAALEILGNTFGYTLTAEQKEVAKACLGFS